MTNAMIILNESVKLMEEGIISGSGRFVTIVNAEGNEVQLEQPEAIHTYATWKSLGYQVKKGEKSVAKFPIWKYVSKMIKNEEDADEEAGHCILKMSAFFKASQVEKLEA